MKETSILLGVWSGGGVGLVHQDIGIARLSAIILNILFMRRMILKKLEQEEKLAEEKKGKEKGGGERGEDYVTPFFF